MRSNKEPPAQSSGLTNVSRLSSVDFWGVQGAKPPAGVWGTPNRLSFCALCLWQRAQESKGLSLLLKGTAAPLHSAQQWVSQQTIFLVPTRGTTT